jgi:hypothetical protein
VFPCREHYFSRAVVLAILSQYIIVHNRKIHFQEV